MKKIVLLALPLLFGGIAHAEDTKFNTNDVSIYGGNVKCPLLIQMLKSNNKTEIDDAKLIIRFYTLGYLSAYNLATYSLIQGHPPEHIGKDINTDYNVEYVSNYCLNNPKDGLPDAVMTLVGHL